MKKKNIIIGIVLGIILLIGGICLVLFNNKEDSYSTIYLEINQSLEIVVDKDENVVSVNPLNDDAKKIVDNDSIGKSLNDLLGNLIDKIIENGYTRDNQLTMLLHVTNDLDIQDIDSRFKDFFHEKDINLQTIVIDEVSSEDKEFAKEHNISEYKAAYINSIKEENEKVDIETLIDKSINELNNTKNTGLYCDDGYFLEGEMCYKEIEKIEAHSGSICPRGFMEYNGKCYEEQPYIETDNYICRDNFTLVNGTCINKITDVARGICNDGEYDGSKDVCYEKEFIGDAYEFCRDSGRTLYDHKCLATKPTINGGCLNGDMLYNGKCVNTRNDYYASEWMCPNGQINSTDKGDLIFPDNKCYKEVEVKPTSYECNDGFVLEGKTCVMIETQTPERERICPSGFTKVPYDRCININNIKDYETGLVCDKENARVEGNVCVVYEVIDAKKW